MIGNLDFSNGILYQLVLLVSTEMHAKYAKPIKLQLASWPATWKYRQSTSSPSPIQKSAPPTNTVELNLKLRAKSNQD